ncbi:MAG: hypothetical protein A2134_03035 [Candidatus Woykebacteria bacterium RBG_16_39_9b]|uniref:YtxH domain-containing protein n=1 Tax=Candidatus Woykebacteria bacterium RBG_16_39_9b TaxID=1802595 RepID=A0A1G1WEH7_9BACT|nr:MAG: hypothetical protein A2134_03035 [Candidatus Woykebacteria bacterium RBG_16_39_9b]
MVSNNNNHETNESHFYKGLFFGLLLGIGAVWFMRTETGKKLKDKLQKQGDDMSENLKRKIDAALGKEFIEDELDEDELEKEKKPSLRKRFFKKIN